MTTNQERITIEEKSTYWHGYHEGYLAGYVQAKKEMMQFIDKMNWDNRNSVEKNYTMTD